MSGRSLKAGDSALPFQSGLDTINSGVAVETCLLEGVKTFIRAINFDAPFRSRLDTFDSSVAVGTCFRLLATLEASI